MEALLTLSNLQTLLFFLTTVIIIIAVIFNIFKFLHEWLEYKYTKLKIEKYEIDMNLEINDNIDKQLDTIIENCFTEYSLTNLIYKSEWYITEEEEIKITKDIAHLVAERMSPIVMQKLTLYYNEDAISDIISKRISFRVTNFVIEHNKNTGI